MVIINEAINMYKEYSKVCDYIEFLEDLILECENFKEIYLITESLEGLKKYRNILFSSIKSTLDSIRLLNYENNGYVGYIYDISDDGNIKFVYEKDGMTFQKILSHTEVKEWYN